MPTEQELMVKRLKTLQDQINTAKGAINAKEERLKELKPICTNLREECTRLFGCKMEDLEAEIAKKENELEIKLSGIEAKMEESSKG